MPKMQKPILEHATQGQRFGYSREAIKNERIDGKEEEEGGQSSTAPDRVA
jgi:hypothetical protein